MHTCNRSYKGHSVDRSANCLFRTPDIMLADIYIHLYITIFVSGQFSTLDLQKYIQKVKTNTRPLCTID